MLKVMFLCTGNSCRSQMAEGFAKEYGKGVIEPYSAGLNPSKVNPFAIEVMHEKGIDISQQSSKVIDSNLLKTMDVVITLCSHAESSCPVILPPQKRMHWPINDPAQVTGSRDEIVDAFRKARDEIASRVKEFIRKIKEDGSL